MWNPKFGEEEDDDSWEIKAFEQDINDNKMGTTTWPPRSYPCNFCRREFRSAQALGGHMNVHRRDRAAARVHGKPRGGRGGLTSPNSLPSPSFVSSPSSTLILQFPCINNNPNIILGRAIDQSTLPTTGFVPSMEFHSNIGPRFAFPVGVQPLNASSIDSARYSCGKALNFHMGDNDNNQAIFNRNSHNQPGRYEEPAAPAAADGLDLELRLGKKTAAPW